MNNNNYVIIMAGGIGSRFWPMSRTRLPKQFQDILGTGKTLIRSTYERFTSFIPSENIFVVTNSSYAEMVKSEIPEMDYSRILKEPIGRNTAPCIAYGAAKIKSFNPDACIFVAASDHLILNEEKFRKDAELGLEKARNNAFIFTLGITPSRPDTGYGYIQYIDSEKDNDCFEVKTFTEKPNLEIAKSFLESGDFLWNSGMFIFSLKTIEKDFQKFLPGMHELFFAINDIYNTEKEKETIEKAYAVCKGISFDYGIMEKAEKVMVIQSSFDWSDLGTWGSVYQASKKDYLENVTDGKIIIYDASHNVIKCTNDKKLVVVEGLNNFIVVDTEDVLLICHMEHEQKIKDIVGDVKSRKKLSEYS